MKPHLKHVELIDLARARKGFLSVDETIRLLEEKNCIVLDPFSVLISADVKIGTDNLFYPNVVIQIESSGSIEIGENNVFYPQTLILASMGGAISIAHENQFGDNGCTVKANVDGSQIIFGSSGRYLNGCQIMGQCEIGDGTQILGQITVQGCSLGSGGSYKEPDPDKRGGLLKGSGLARDVSVPTGSVLNATGYFDDKLVEKQSKYH